MQFTATCKGRHPEETALKKHRGLSALRKRARQAATCLNLSQKKNPKTPEQSQKCLGNIYG